MQEWNYYEKKRGKLKNFEGYMQTAGRNTAGL